MAKPAVTNALTIDFEDWYQGLEIPHTEWDRFEDRIELAGNKLLQILDDSGVRATFFILGFIAEKHPGIVKRIEAAGHEVGTHGFSHSLIYRQTPEVFKAEMERAVGFLQNLTGKPVLGHRAPFFSITKESLWALDILGSLGVKYDSSIFPVLNYRYGIADAPRFPYEIERGGFKFTEFPISTLKMGKMTIPISGGAYFRIYPYHLTRQFLKAANRDGKPFTFYLHPWELDPGHPRVEMPRRVARMTHYFNLGATERRFRKLLKDFKFAPMKDVLNIC
ncbi:MAG TPA: XrtA system polysaccharide deacetylase [Pyrinomonadaceae bacterium]|nr:XrtA system polysaccharide deacetylase [Pyrinomonadaceae bacterium]